MLSSHPFFTAQKQIDTELQLQSNQQHFLQAHCAKMQHFRSAFCHLDTQVLACSFLHFQWLREVQAKLCLSSPLFACFQRPCCGRRLSVISWFAATGDPCHMTIAATSVLQKACDPCAMDLSMKLSELMRTPCRVRKWCHIPNLILHNGGPLRPCRVCDLQIVLYSFPILHLGPRHNSHPFFLQSFFE